MGLAFENLKKGELVKTKTPHWNDSARVPFRFHKGERVAWKRSNGSPDPDMRGVIEHGCPEYQEGGGWYEDEYIVRREDGTTFRAGHFDLVQLE